ncbi:MAG TPA: hypothetical protein VGA91_05810 [Candidatus Limnocylindria bacterium]
MVRRLALALAAAWLVLAAIVLGRFADEALPATYLVRPLALELGVAFGIGAGSLIARGHAVAVAAGAAVLVALPEPVLVLTLVGVLIGAELLRRAGRMRADSQRPVLVLVGVFFSLGLIRALSVIDLPSNVGYSAVSGGPPMYVVLLDGYPRIDTLAELGIDNSSFVNALEERGFDHYPQAMSSHTKTHKTLLAMLTDEVVTDDPVTIEARRGIRERLVVPPGFVAVDPPIGFVTLGPGPHIDPGGSNDFEGQLLAQSVVGVMAPDLAWAALAQGLRERIDASLDVLVASPELRIFVHLVAPHPPFLYEADGSAGTTRQCWPECALFANSIEDRGTTRESWASSMTGNVKALNARVLAAVDRLIAAHPDAVIVLFSDHGGRISEAERDEWHRSFLAARTPGHPGVFADAPRPDTIIRTLLATYESGTP